MNYHSRLVESRLATLSGMFPVVVVTGARQVGKTTLLEHALRGAAKKFVFDPLDDRFGVREDPDFFLDQHPPPLLLDEVQYAPELLPALKRRVDRIKKPGQYFLSGSQNLSVLKDVAESMAGRAGVLELPPLCVAEWACVKTRENWLEKWLLRNDEFNERSVSRGFGDTTLTQVLWRGFMPGLLDRERPEEIVEFHNSYVLTYLERDARRAGEIRNLEDFRRLLGLLGALTGQEIRQTQLGRELGVSRQTAKEWLSILEGTYQWWSLPPYHGNVPKRLSSHSKGYLQDTGLACFLQRISSPESLAISPLRGAVFETFAVNNLSRHARGMTPAPRFHHWRSHAGAEVDVVIELDGRLWPFECKAGVNVAKRDLTGIRAFRETYGEKAKTPAAIICAVPEARRLTPDVWLLPYDIL